MDMMTQPASIPGLPPKAVQALIEDAHGIPLIKAYLAIPDESVRKKLRRLAEEIAQPFRRADKAGGQE